MNSTAHRSTQTPSTNRNESISAETPPQKPSQGLLFSEPAIAETGVWCELNEGIDPAQWAQLCRQLGSMSPGQFKRAQKKLLPNPDGLIQRLKRMFTPDANPNTDTPLVSLGPSGIYGNYQKEVYSGSATIA
ncbi:hypothetical protein STSP2_03126 [Anaerohalosphaera lusitana]|uniref:Uncharacterized protein n=1 Tax=Anaerohalosphaera lusitana TaxID=1936003 RepID=A0A1U9NQY7_9BACT|nr:hypothetical protein [Anaerohalosphaera lusitana]AQT69926.1 hypothetical protein STSP2_03126 [Anaerohalosphaera lusitana]